MRLCSESSVTTNSTPFDVHKEDRVAGLLNIQHLQLPTRCSSGAQRSKGPPKGACRWYSEPRHNVTPGSLGLACGNGTKTSRFGKRRRIGGSERRQPSSRPFVNCSRSSPRIRSGINLLFSRERAAADDHFGALCPALCYRQLRLSTPREQQYLQVDTQ